MTLVEDLSAVALLSHFLRNHLSMKKKVAFREYNQNQMTLPSSLITLIPENHVVTVVNEIIDSI